MACSLRAILEAALQFFNPKGSPLAISASVDITVTPIKLTVVSDRRKVTGTVTSQGETASYSAQFPITVNDTSGRTWTKTTDDGITAVYTS